jgi:sugar phosphate isomerase/epimerase
MTMAGVSAVLDGVEAIPGDRRLGLVIHSLWNRWQGKYSSVKLPPLREVEEVLDYCVEIGCGGLQTTVADWTVEVVRRLRGMVEGYGVYVEGSVELPRSRTEVERFEREVRRSKEAGVTVFRSYFGGRRYEDHRTLESFQRYREQAWERMVLAEPVLRRHGVRLGVENHKDFRSGELAEMLRRLSSAHVGCCLDFGNNLALLEETEAVLEAVGPYLVTTHLKDMAVQPDEAGFLLAEVPLGQGMLDLPGLIKKCLEANRQITFNLEMITRDPLRIPCLEAGYWAAMPEVGGAALAATLRLVRDKKSERLGRVGGRSLEALCLWEAEQNEACVKHAVEKLGFVRQAGGAE